MREINSRFIKNTWYTCDICYREYKDRAYIDGTHICDDCEDHLKWVRDCWEAEAAAAQEWGNGIRL